MKKIAILSLFLYISLFANEQNDNYKIYTDKFMSNCASNEGETPQELKMIKSICECAWTKAKSKFSVKDFEIISNNDENNPKSKLLLDYLELNLDNCSEKFTKK